MGHARPPPASPGPASPRQPRPALLLSVSWVGPRSRGGPREDRTEAQDVIGRACRRSTRDSDVPNENARIRAIAQACVAFPPSSPTSLIALNRSRLPADEATSDCATRATPGYGAVRRYGRPTATSYRCCLTRRLPAERDHPPLTCRPTQVCCWGPPGPAGRKHKNQFCCGQGDAGSLKCVERSWSGRRRLHARRDGDLEDGTKRHDPLAPPRPG
jgi:hypothetical protein